MKTHHSKTINLQERKKESLNSMLRDYYLEGCEISLKGKEVQPWQAADCCLRESVNYMMDFIPEADNDHIVQIDLVPIADEEPEPMVSGERYIGWCS